MNNVSLLTTFWCVLLVWFIHIPSSAQNPLEIKSRLDSNVERTKTAGSAQQNVTTDLSAGATQNPFDVKKGANRVKSKEKPVKEIKRDVNEVRPTLRTPIKFVILALFLGFFVLIRNMNQKGLEEIFGSMTNQSQLISYKASINGPLNGQLALFYVFFFLNIAYFIYLSSFNHWHPPFSGILLYVAILVAVIAIYLIKYIALYLIEYAFDIRRAIANHLFSVSIQNIVVGIGIFAINVFYAFTDGGASKFLFVLGIILIVAGYLYRQVRGLTFVSDVRQFSIIHFFLYLCACEISPLLVAVKLVTS